ncbi:hypothetical protein ElyMa_003970200 [Elysia marginata]|uniref:BTB domain-containing protein n=1 Tax=Elysia marginata TaxID=1093978 RepID=A0AAV4FW59_9GAST|nr:hypothetical protein ElyMa_003970200 [Elysia marginata]
MSHYLSKLLHKMSTSNGVASPMDPSKLGEVAEKIPYSKAKPQLSVSESNASHHTHFQPSDEPSHFSNRHQHPQANEDNWTLPQHANVLLIVNCDDIKASSLQTFLVYIYLGQSQLTAANVCDLYLLACSLRINCLKDKCRDFMQQEHISEEKLKVPELVLSSALGGRRFQNDSKQSKKLRQDREMRDKACATADDQQELGGQKILEDKAMNTVGIGTGGIRRNGGHMEVATQTDRSTHEAGVRGSQEEWVMLKKTKQKTVSPSKSKSSFAAMSKSSLILAGAGAGSTGSSVGGYGPHGKLQTIPESLGGQQYHHIHKLGKKGWLSPKRRYKTELHQTDSRASNTTSAASKDSVSSSKDQFKVPCTDNYIRGNSKHGVEADPLGVTNDAAAQQGAQNNTSDIGSQSIKEYQASSDANKDLVDSSHQSSLNVTFPIVVTKGPLVSATKTTRTTVEIAEEAAAAKICAHSYGTRTARGTARNPISYAALASGNRKKPHTSPCSSVVSKKKAFIKTISQPSLSAADDKSVAVAEEDNARASVDGQQLLGKPSDSFDLPSQQNSERLTRAIICPLKKNKVHRTENKELTGKEETPEGVKVCVPSKENVQSQKQISHCSHSIKAGNVDKDIDLVDPSFVTRIVEPDLEVPKTIGEFDADFSGLAVKSQVQAGSSSSSQASAKKRTVLQNFRKRLIQQLNSEQLTKAASPAPSVADCDDNLQSNMSEVSGNTPSAPIMTYTQSAVTADKNKTLTAVVGSAITSQTSSAADSAQDTSPMTETSPGDLQLEAKFPSPVINVSHGQSKHSSCQNLISSSTREPPLTLSQNPQPAKKTQSLAVEGGENSSQTNRNKQNTMQAVSENQSHKETGSCTHVITVENDAQESKKHGEEQTIAVTDQEEEIFTHKIFKRKKKIKFW